MYKYHTLYINMQISFCVCELCAMDDDDDDDLRMNKKLSDAFSSHTRMTAVVENMRQICVREWRCKITRKAKIQSVYNAHTAVRHERAEKILRHQRTYRTQKLYTFEWEYQDIEVFLLFAEECCKKNHSKVKFL